MPIETLTEIQSKSAPDGYVYFIRLVTESDAEDAPTYLKIGYGRDPRARLSQMQTGIPFDLDLEDCFPGGIDDERNLHRRFAAKKVRREWFKFDDEMFAFLDDLRDARAMLQIEHGEDYEPSLQECLAVPEPGAAYQEFLACLHRGLATLGQTPDL